MTADLVTVTGASGFVGAHLVRVLLERGYRVRALVRRPASPALAGLDVETALCDVRDAASVRGALRGARFLVHSAALYNLAGRHARALFDTNVYGTRQVMEAAISAGVQRVVYTSSVSAIGAVRGRLATEDDAPPPLALPGPYERSKWVAERLVQELAGNRDLPAVIVNPATVVGAWDSRPTRTGRLIIDAARGRVPAYVATGMNFVSARDVALGHLLALEQGKVGRRYILGGENMTLAGFLSRVDRIAGRTTRRARIPVAVAYMAALTDERLASRLAHRDPSIPLAGVRQARVPMYYDGGRARRELGLQPSPIDTALAEALEWFGRNGHC